MSENSANLNLFSVLVFCLWLSFLLVEVPCFAASPLPLNPPNETTQILHSTSTASGNVHHQLPPSNARRVNVPRLSLTAGVCTSSGVRAALTTHTTSNNQPITILSPSNHSHSGSDTPTPSTSRSSGRTLSTSCSVSSTPTPNTSRSEQAARSGSSTTNHNTTRSGHAPRSGSGMPTPNTAWSGHAPCSGSNTTTPNTARSKHAPRSGSGTPTPNTSRSEPTVCLLLTHHEVDKLHVLGAVCPLPHLRIFSQVYGMQ